MTLNDVEDHQILNEMYVHACRDLLSAYGLTVSVQERAGKATGRLTASFISILSASGGGISLSSTLKIDQALVIRLHPAESSNISLPDMADWCLELNNQLVGRVKNKLLGYGHAVDVGLPVLLTGTDVSGLAPPDSEVHRYSVESAEGYISLTLATFVAPGIGLHDMDPLMVDDVLLEGQVALF